MNKYILSILLLLSGVSTACYAQSHARVKVSLQGTHPQSLSAIGIETDHGEYRPGESFTTDLSYDEIQAVQAAGYVTEVLIDSVELWYAKQLASNSSVQSRGADDCGSGPDLQIGTYTTPKNYTYGSMGGYPTYSELLVILDEMHEKFPDLVTAATPISTTLLTHEGRPVYWLRISDNAAQDEDEPEVLYTALHHAREPNGLSQMLFFMWYVLENYETQPEIKLLLDRCELYFVPCINPDGYVYNEQTFPQGGGLWRKNRRDNGDGTFGVDLNRNYGYQWGFDDEGSSTNPNSSAYRGPAPFSEPETQMMRDFCTAHNFKIALNYHTFSNLLIYPWAYTDTTADPDQAALATLLVQENKYRAGTVSETVGYPVNGSSDDWMLSARGIFSFTPEVGPLAFGFWPPADTIDGLNKANMWANLAAPWSLLRFGTAEDLSEDAVTLITDLPVRMTRYGLQDGPLTMKLTALSSNITQITPAVTTLNLSHLQSAVINHEFTVSEDIQFGDLLVFELSIDNGDFMLRDTLVKTWRGGLRVEAFTEAPNNPNTQWAGEWSTTSSTFVTAPSSFTDSPDDLYASFAQTSMTSLESISIPANAVEPRLLFDARWHLEDGYDWVQVEAVSVTSGVGTLLCGRYSRPGSENQLPGEPIWDGFQPVWLKECIDLSAFKGRTFNLRFTLFSDAMLNFDGFYFDNLEVSYIDTTLSSVKPLNDMLAEQAVVQPNPAQNRVQISWPITRVPLRADIYNGLGQLVWSQRIEESAEHRLDLDTSLWPNGGYIVRLRGDKVLLAPLRFSIFR